MISFIALASALARPAYAQEQHFSFDIPSQPLSSALLELGRQMRLSVAAPSELMDDRIAPALKGEFTSSDAFEKILAGSGLSFEFVQSDAVRIYRKQRADLLPGRTPGEAQEDRPDRVIVTGTNIRGAESASSLDVYTSRDIAATGAVTTEQFIAKLPQNLGRTSQYGAGATAEANYDSVTSVDLRGLGVGTTLTLLNGRRMALSNSGQSADVSLIPASAIERVEVLTDGASAVYGSDAIGGVVNFVLRRDFKGAETRLSYGGVTNGGMRQGDASETLGTGWGTGNGLLSYAYHSASALDRTERTYSAPAGPGTLTPYDERHNLFASLEQDLGDRLRVSLDLGGGTRKVKNRGTNFSTLSPLFSNRSTYRSTTDQSFANLALNYEISGDLNAEVSATYSKVDIDGALAVLFFNRNPQRTNRGNYSTSDEQRDVMAKLDGVLLALPAGPLRFSAGGGVLEEEFTGYSPLTGVQGAGVLGRRSPYVFGEVFAPLISADMNMPFVRNLSLNLAARYTDYQDDSRPALDRDFGDSTDPRIGVLWSPFQGLDLRATYGTSFRAPFLTQLDPSSGIHYLGVASIGGVPGSYLAIAGASDPDLSPETARTYAWGFRFAPDALVGFEISGSYYNIDYTDRIGVAPFGGLDPFTTPNLLPDLIYRPPSAAFIEEQLTNSPLLFNGTSVSLTDPHAAAATLYATPDFWIYDTRFKNLAVSKTDGFDLAIRQSLATDVGDIQLGANITHILAYKQKGSPSANTLTAIDVPGQPADWRGRAYASLATGAFNGTLSVNYVDGYVNPSIPTAPQPVSDWLTVDLNLAYQISAGAPGEARGPRLSLSVQNLFDEEPPRLNTGARSNLVSPIGFDPANANPLGRFVTVGLSQVW